MKKMIFSYLFGGCGNSLSCLLYVFKHCFALLFYVFSWNCTTLHSSREIHMLKTLDVTLSDVKLTVISEVIFFELVGDDLQQFACYKCVLRHTKTMLGRVSNFKLRTFQGSELCLPQKCLVSLVPLIYM